jgi:hypothetical protein
VLSALIFGTFAPDLEFFIRFEPAGHFGHSTRGFFFFSMPVALIAFWLFHYAVKEPLAALMPQLVRQKIVPGVYPLSLRRPFQLLLVLISVLVGAGTHILWDSLTHGGYWPARHFPWFWESVHVPRVGDLFYYKILQYVSTVFGMVVVLFWFVHWIRTAPEQRYPAGSNVPQAQARIARILIPLIALAGGLLRAVVGVGRPETPRDVQAWIVDLVVTAISLTWLELMVWGFTLPVRRSQPTPERDHANVA